MIKHMVLLKLHDDATAEQRAAVIDALRQLAVDIPKINKEWCVNENVRHHEPFRGTHEVGLVGEFSDMEELDAYIAHPAHADFVGKLLGLEVLAGHAICDIEV